VQLLNISTLTVHLSAPYSDVVVLGRIQVSQTMEEAGLSRLLSSSSDDGGARDFFVVGDGTQARCFEKVVVKIKELAILLLAVSVEGCGAVRSMEVCKESC
jgi:hypothetical protein